jgi:hypothetical protein
VAGTFAARIERLGEIVGKGKLVGRVEFDQVYAHYQEVNDQFEHPNGGQAHYLGDTLLAGQPETWGGIARELLDEGPIRSMVDGVERVAREAEGKAPWEYTNLKFSAHPTVNSNGGVVYDRAPVQERLTDEELRMLDAERMAVNPYKHHPYGARSRGQGVGGMTRAELEAKQHAAIVKAAQERQAELRAARKKAGRPPQKSAPRRPGFPLPPGSA